MREKRLEFKAIGRWMAKQARDLDGNDFFMGLV
jgi:hypothetical protein